MNKIVYNSCEGVFGLSTKAIAHILRQNKPGIKLYFYKQLFCDFVKYTKYKRVSESEKADVVSLKDFGECFSTEEVNSIEIRDNFIHWADLNLSRHDPRLIKAVEELGKEANGKFSNLCIAEIDSNLYVINEYMVGYEDVITPEDIDWIKI